MVGKHVLVSSIALAGIGLFALRSPSQTVPTPPKSAPPSTPARPELTPEQKHRQEIFNALFNRRRRATIGATPNDNASRLLAKVASGEVRLDNSDLKSLTRSVLAALDVPLSSQLLVYSGSASQGTNVNPRNPRAIYFNDEVYVGMVPGGLLEMIGVDPNIGGVLYTFRDVGTGRAPTTTDGKECARCHAREQSGYAMGFFLRSIVPNQDGFLQGSDNLGFEGHARPLGRRFGGWFVTSARPDVFGKAGLLAITEGEKPRRVIGYQNTQPGQLYDPKKHLGEGSDILAHLLHEHQIGFHNRVAAALMSADDDGKQNGEQVAFYTHDQTVSDLAGYMLFRFEAALPANGIVGDPKFIADFSRNRHPAKSGAALKDLDLTTHLLKHRFTYMIYTRPWIEMPSKVKNEVYAKLRDALFGNSVIGNHLSLTEKREIVQILVDTVPDLPATWK